MIFGLLYSIDYYDVQAVMPNAHAVGLYIIRSHTLTPVMYLTDLSGKLVANQVHRFASLV